MTHFIVAKSSRSSVAVRTNNLRDIEAALQENISLVLEYQW